jgi:hypothetical protein
VSCLSARRETRRAERIGDTEASENKELARFTSGDESANLPISTPDYATALLPPDNAVPSRGLGSYTSDAAKERTLESTRRKYRPSSTNRVTASPELHESIPVVAPLTPTRSSPALFPQILTDKVATLAFRMGEGYLSPCALRCSLGSTRAWRPPPPLPSCGLTVSLRRTRKSE